VGDAYHRFGGPQRKAKEAARAPVFDLVQDRFEDVEMYDSDQPWSRWFFDVAWDQTWILVDRGEARATVICTTDTD